MKKRKVGFLFNIITICLAVVAIAVGVYSLQKSSLNISGSLGFTAHNVNARIDAYMYGYATEAGGIPLTESEKVRLTTANGLLIHNSATSYSLNLGATNGSGSAIRYFSNLGASGEMEDIVVEITVSNTSGGTSTPKNILANVDFANCIPSSALTGKIRIDCDRSGAVLETTNGKTQATFTFRISLLPNSDGTYTNSALTSSSNNVSLKMNLEETNYTQSQVRTDAIAIKKFTTAEISSINSTLSITTNDSYADLYPYYVEMGHVGNDYVKWLVVGTKGASDTDAVTALVDADKTALSQGLLLNKTYVMLSEKVLYNSVPFQTKFTNSQSTTPVFKNTNSDYSAYDYATSTIRSYLNGDTITYNKTIYSFFETYNVDTDPLYVKIKGRSLSSLYNNIGEIESGAKIWSSADSVTDDNLKSTTKDKLWLLSKSEIETLLSVANNRKTSKILGTADSNYTEWFTRSPYKYFDNHMDVHYVFDTLLVSTDVDYSSAGSRPAFLF